MKKAIIAIAVISFFTSCREQVGVKYIKMGGQAIKESLPVSKTPSATLCLPQQACRTANELSVVQGMEAGVLRMTR
jgi:hypothetical protein